MSLQVKVSLVSSLDLEHKPDIVWPHSEQIIISAVSECGCFMAMGLTTGTVVVWDVYRGKASNITGSEVMVIAASYSWIAKRQILTYNFGERGLLKQEPRVVPWTFC